MFVLDILVLFLSVYKNWTWALAKTMLRFAVFKCGTLFLQMNILIGMMRES